MSIVGVEIILMIIIWKSDCKLYLEIGLWTIIVNRIVNQNGRVKENINNELNIWHWDLNSNCPLFFATSMLKSFCKSIIFSGICRIFCVLSFCSIKTWFKSLWDIFYENLHATLDSQLIKYFAQKAPAGRLSGKTYDFRRRITFWGLKKFKM